VSNEAGALSIFDCLTSKLVKTIKLAQNSKESQNYCCKIVRKQISNKLELEKLE
jgi:ribosomal protein L33